MKPKRIFVTQEGIDLLKEMPTPWDGQPKQGTLHATARLTGLGVKTIQSFNAGLPISESTAQILNKIIGKTITEER